MPLSATARGLLGIYVPSLIMSMGQSMAAPTIPALARAFEITPGLAAQVLTSQLLGRVLAGVPSGFLLDRVGARSSMLLGSALVAGGAGAAFLAPSFGWLLAAQFLAGVGGSLWLLGREVATVDLVQQEQRGRAMSAIFGVTSVGVVMGPLLGGFLTDLVSFRAVFLSYFVLASISLGVAALTGQRRRGAPAPPRVAPSPHTSSLNRLTVIAPEFRLTYLVLIVGTFAAMLRLQGLNSMLPLYMGSYLGFSTSEVGVQFGIMGLFSVLMIGPAGYISDHLGRKAASVPAAVLSVVLFVGYPFATSVLPLSVLSAVAGIANGFALGAMTTYTYDIVPNSHRGQLQSFRRAAGELGGLTGPAAGGAIATFIGPGMAFLLLAPVHVIAALLLAFLARESLPRRVRSTAPG